MVSSVIVNYKCRVMTLFAGGIYPADSCSPGANAIAYLSV